MAPNTSGHKFTDHVRQIELAHMALNVAASTVKQGGAFVVKVFDGEEAHGFTLAVRKVFKRVRRIKPEATRNESVEFAWWPVKSENPLDPMTSPLNKPENQKGCHKDSLCL